MNDTGVEVILESGYYKGGAISRPNVAVHRYEATTHGTCGASPGIAGKRVARLSLIDYRPAEFGSPIGRTGTRFWSNQITLVKVARRFVPAGLYALNRFVIERVHTSPG